MDNNFSFYVHIFIRSFRKYLIFSLYSWKMKNLFYLSLRHANEYNEIKTCQCILLRVPYIKFGQEILYTFTIIGHTAKVYIIFWAHFRLQLGQFFFSKSEQILHQEDNINKTITYECEGISLILVRTRILLYSLFLSPTAKANQVYLTSVLTYSYSFTS